MENKAIIFDIKRFALHDGEGLRTTIFFKGCPLSCKWCHNPEGIDGKCGLLFKNTECAECLKCVNVCQYGALNFSDKIDYDKSKCHLCKACVSICPTNKIVENGKYYELSELVALIEKDNLYYSVSNGGITLSGGEIFSQIDFVEKLLKELKALGYHTTVETSFFTSSVNIERIIDYIDCLYVDLKIFDSKLHQKYCGSDNKIILENIEKFASDKMIIRVPIIPGINNDQNNLSLTKEFCDKLNLKIEPLNYNPLAPSKYQMLKEDYFNPSIKPLDYDEFKDISNYYK